LAIEAMVSPLSTAWYTSAVAGVTEKEKVPIVSAANRVRSSLLEAALRREAGGRTLERLDFIPSPLRECRGSKYRVPGRYLRTKTSEYGTVIRNYKPCRAKRSRS